MRNGKDDPTSRYTSVRHLDQEVSGEGEGVCECERETDRERECLYENDTKI